MTKQEYFNTAWRGFAAQDWRRAVGPYGACYYQVPGGTDRCAVGHLLPAEVDAQTLGGSVWDQDISGFFPREDLSFLSDLQAVHDFASEDDPLRSSMIRFAARHNLQVPE